MAVTPLRLRLGEKIRKYLISSKLKQRDLAGALGISCSAVSQMISGKIVPQQEQLDIICDQLSLTRDQMLELTAMLTNIRNGQKTLRSKFNQLFAAARRERGVDAQQLANLTGVSCSRLQLLENCFDATPTLEEINRLAPVLSCAPEDMLLAAGMGRPVIQDGNVQLSEPTVDYQFPSQKMLPVLELAQLADCRPGESLLNYAASKALRQTAYGADLPVPAVAISADCRELKIGAGGEVLILVASERPQGFREIELFRDRNGQYRLRERRRGCWKVFQLPPVTTSAGYALWSLPVLELIIRPVRPGGSPED